MGYVYLLLEVDKRGDETHKIGITKNNPNDRNSGLQTGNPNKIRVLQVYESKNYKKVEKWMHKKFHASKTEADNEWRYLSDVEINTFITECKKADKTIDLLLKNNPFYT